MLLFVFTLFSVQLDIVFHFNKVYALLDEFILAGEVQETNKKVILGRLNALEKLEWENLISLLVYFILLYVRRLTLKTAGEISNYFLIFIFYFIVHDIIKITNILMVNNVCK